jgi:hypothetical protein
LVLDFTISTHSKAELIGAHRRVVEMFRAKRFVNGAGIKSWDNINRDDAVTAYVLDECTHHIKGAHEDGDPPSEDVLLSWLADQPQDALCQAVSGVLGEDVLVRAAESCEAAGDMWSAAFRWAAAGDVAFHTRGMVPCGEMLTHAFEAVRQVRQSTKGSYRCSVDDVDQLEVEVVRPLMMYAPHLLSEIQPRIDPLLQTKAGKARPDLALGLMLFADWAPAWFAGDVPKLRAADTKMLEHMVREGCEGASSDQSMREFCCIALGFFGFWSGALIGPDFRWEIFGEDGQHCLTAISSYDYDKHHLRLTEALNADYHGCTMGCIPDVLGLHYGDLESVATSFETMVDTLARAELEPNQTAEAMGLRIVSQKQVWPYIFGYGEAFGTVIRTSSGATWEAIDSRLDEFATSPMNGWWAPRDETGTGPWIASIETNSWGTKLNLALCCGEGAVSKQQMQSLPSPEHMAKLAIPGPDSMAGGAQSAPMHSAVSVHLLAALASENYQLDDQALGFVAAIHELDYTLGGDPKESSHILAHCIKGRIMARRGQLKAAAAAFEAAVTRSKEVELWLLTAFALRDLKLCVLDGLGHGDHGSRRLGAALRRLKGPAERLNGLLNGLDAAELMTLSEPEPGYEVAYGASADVDSTEAALRLELGSMKLKDLRKRAKDVGMTAEQLDQAMDSEDPEEEVITYLLGLHAADANARAGETALVSELQGLRLKELRQRAKEVGITAEELDTAMDSDEPEAAVIELIVALTESPAGVTEPGLLAELQDPKAAATEDTAGKRDFTLLVTSTFFAGKRKVQVSAGSVAELTSALQASLGLSQPFAVVVHDEDFDEDRVIAELEDIETDKAKVQLVEL